jgi:hypothetical protein
LPSEESRSCWWQECTRELLCFSAFLGLINQTFFLSFFLSWFFLSFFLPSFLPSIFSFSFPFFLFSFFLSLGH